MDTSAYNDQPIAVPNEDRFGIDPFAATLASSICKLKAPTGSVIALNGPWGSGKSSAVNLIRHHLDAAVKAEELAVIDFACWWFRGEDALALAFFRELYAGLSPSLGDKIKKALPKLGARLLGAGAALGGIADAAGAGGVGAAAGGAMEWLSGLIAQDESVEKLHGELSKALGEQKKRFLVVIDDIDRLSPDEALLIFRLVKSVGRLPNVMYLLVYDRQLAEKIVSERYPSEGPHYLEKIVQAAFELPEPSPTDMQQHLLSLIASICGEPAEDQAVRFMNIFYEGVAPEMKTPRDVARFTNSLTVTWPAVAGEVDIADFVMLEVLRLLHPNLYRTIRQNKELLCRDSSEGRRDREAQAKRFDAMLLDSEAEHVRERLRAALIRLFPALESAWTNTVYGDGSVRQWAMERRVCSSAHFDSYFRFSVGDETLSRAELDIFLKRAGDRNFIIDTLRQAVGVQRKSGGTKAALILGELNTYADKVSNEDVLPLLSALFAVADEINVPADQSRGFSIANNELRIHWLLRRLTLDRMTLAERSAVLFEASEGAALGWLANLFSSAWTNYHPRDGEAQAAPERCLMVEPDTVRLRDLLKERLEAAAKDGSLAKSQDLASLLYSWNEITDDNGAAVRAWTANLIEHDDGVHKLAAAFTSYGWSQAMGDMVAKRITRIQVTHLDKLTDVPAFRKRIEDVAALNKYPEVTEFLAVWRRIDAGERY